MSGYDLPIRDDNERQWYANVGAIQERERIVKLLLSPEGYGAILGISDGEGYEPLLALINKKEGNK